MKYTNKYNLPNNFYEAVVNDPYDFTPTDKSISVTGLISPPMVNHLQRRHYNELEADVSDSIWTLFGSAGHAVMERIPRKSDRIIEKRIEVTIDGITVSGKCDLIDGTKLMDYKFTSVYAVIYNPEGKKEWVEQLNVLAYLWKSMNKSIDKLEIHAILKDWRKPKQYDAKYPPIPFHVIDIPLWSVESQEAFIKERIKIFKDTLLVPDEDITPCTPEERWAMPTKYAIMKAGRKTAIRVFDSELEAVDFLPESSGTYIEVRKGKDNRCEGYCSVKKFCKYWRDNEQIHANG